MDEKNNLVQVSQFISKTFALQGINNFLEKDDFIDLTELHAYLTDKIADMIDDNYSTLVNALYRIDIDEEKINSLFSSTNREYIPASLADLIIQRQIQKLKFRQLYKDGKL